MRKAKIERNTLETKIMVELELDGEGKSNIHTGIGFFDHMLTLFARHGSFDLNVTVDGDVFVDGHHTVEDTGIVLGQALAKAIGDKQGISRYGASFVPMDEALAHVAVDISGRAYLVYQAEIKSPMVGGFDTELVEEFFRALALQSGLTLHVRLLYGTNAHHCIEAMFKAFARALSEAAQYDPTVKGVLSTKGVL